MKSANLAFLYLFACNPNFSVDNSGNQVPDASSEVLPDSGALPDAAPDASASEADPDCPNPSYPEDCEEGDLYCWPPEVDCRSTLFACGIGASRCIDPNAYAACCDGDFYVCGPAVPWYCFADGRCYSNAEACPDPDAGALCDFRGVPCS